MPVNRRVFSNPTRPKRCNALIPNEDDSPAVKCTDRVVRSGLCGKHYTNGQKAREVRRKTITRHKLGIDLSGKMTYGTVEGSDSINWCSTGKCRRRPIINLDNTLYCQICFMREQRKRNKNKPMPVVAEN